MQKLSGTLEEALEQVRAQIPDLPLEERHSAVLSVEMLEKCLAYMSAKGEQGGPDAFSDAAFDVMSAQASVVASLAMTVTRGDTEEALKFLKAWMTAAEGHASKVIRQARDGGNGINIIAEVPVDY